MSFLDHLEELRWHVIRSLIAAVIAAITIFFFKDFLFNTVIYGPLNGEFPTYQWFCSLSESLNLGQRLCFEPVALNRISVEFGETFFLHIKISFIMGLILAFPYIFWEFWRFIKPGLHKKEQKMTRGVVFVCSLLFLMGVLFGYFIIAPFAVNFLASYTIPAVENTPRITSFVNYMVMFVVPAGMIFELPIVVYFLSKLGLLTPAFMKKYRKHSLIIILILAAVITPPDIITQFLIGIPLYILYEISIIICRRVTKRLEKEAKAS